MAGLGWLAGLAVVSTVGAIALFFAGLRRVGPTAASILSTLEPVVTVVAGVGSFSASRSAPRSSPVGHWCCSGCSPSGRRRATRLARRPLDCDRRVWRASVPAMTAPLHGKVALVAGATRGAGRGTAVALGEAGATVYCTGRSTRGQRSEYDRPETIEETAELVDDGRWHRDRSSGRPSRPAQVDALVAADRSRAGAPRRARQRHLGRRAALRVEHAGVGARPREGAADAAPGGRHPPDHQPFRAAAADPRARRAGGGDDRRHAGVQRRPLPNLGVLRPGQDRGHPAGLRPGPASWPRTAAPQWR